MSSHAERPDKLCEVVWSLSDGGSVRFVDEDNVLSGAVAGSNGSVSGGLI